MKSIIAASLVLTGSVAQQVYKEAVFDVIGVVDPTQSCDASTFTQDMNGQLCLGLQNKPASNADECMQHACADGAEVWQWCASVDNCGASAGGCWVGTASDCHQTGSWTSKSRPPIIQRVTYAQGLACDAQQSNCKPKDLELEVYQPVAQDGGPAVPAKKPAIILEHGGGNGGGSKEQYPAGRGSAAFFAARGFVGFNIDYRLGYDNGKLPGVRWPAEGARLITHVQRNDDRFWPHPGSSAALAAISPTPTLSCDASDFPRVLDGWLCLGLHSKPASNADECIQQACADDAEVWQWCGDADNCGASAGGCWVGNTKNCHQDEAYAKWSSKSRPQPPQKLQLGTAPEQGGKLSDLCLAVDASDERTVRLSRCDSGDAAQGWHLDLSTIDQQSITHAASGKCLDVPSAGAQSAADLPIEVAPCTGSSAGDSTQLWVLGYSGALFTRGAAMSARVERGGLQDWNPTWESGYPAVRDSKAAVRFVRANAEKYGVDPDRIAVGGGSAGATNMLTVGVSFDGDYKDEISVDDDPTLATTNMEQSSSVQCVVAHWASDGEIELIREKDPQNLSRYSKSNAPVVSFHGDKDDIIPIHYAKAVQAAYAQTGVDYELHVLEGCGHGPDCYDGQGQCGCSGGYDSGYNSLVDEIALPFVAKHLGLELVDGDARFV